jgi:uncharacterized protein YciI
VELYVVRQRRGGPWDWTRDLYDQVGIEDHRRFVNGLVDAGFTLLGGPVDEGREVLLVIRAPDEEAIRQRLAEDPWASNGMLRVVSVERWTILLDGLDRAAR